MLRCLTLLMAGVPALLLIACDSAPAVEGDRDPVVAALEDRMTALADSLRAANNIQGAAFAYIKDGQVLVKEGVGFAHTANRTPVTAQTPFFIASISKLFTGWGALRLVGEGHINQDDPIEAYLDTWRYPPSAFNSNASTLRRLLAHQGGTSLSGYPGFPPGVPLPSTEASLSGATNGAGDVRLVYEPGTETRYSGGGITVIQLAVENVSDQSFSDYMASNLFDPLGMDDSSFELTPALASRLATPYSGTRVIDPPRFAALGAAGMISTVDDMVTFALAVIRAYDGNDVGIPGLSKATLDALLSIPLNAPISYAGANQIRRINGMRTIGHTGGHPGWATIMHIAPEEGHALIVLTNNWDGIRVHNGLMCTWYEELTVARVAEFCWVFDA